MANIKYRLSIPTVEHTSTVGADSPLTNLDIDKNLYGLNLNKLENKGYTKGDIVYSNSLGNLVPLSFSSNKVLYSDPVSGLPTWTASVGDLTAYSLSSIKSVFNIGAIQQSQSLSATLTSGSNTVSLTTGTTANLVIGQLLSKVSGTGVFGASARIASVVNSTTFTTSVNHTTSGAITFTANSADNTTANGGGITLKGTTDKTLLWDSTNLNWTSSENFNLPSTKVYKINNVEVISSTNLFQVPHTSLLPNSIAVTNISRSSNVVTVTTASAHGFIVNDVISNIGVSGSTSLYANSVTVVSAPSTTSFTYNQTGINESTTSGYYYKESGLSSFIRRDSSGTSHINNLLVNRVTSGIWNGYTIQPTYGGTGLSSYTSGDILYASSSNTLSKLAKGTDGQILKLSAGLPSWSSDNDTLQSIASDTTNASRYVTFVSSATGSQTGLSSSKLLFNPSTGDLTVGGNLIVNGTTSTINSSTITVDDKNIELGSVASGVVSATGTVGSISGTGPWSATLSNLTTTSGLIVGSSLSATSGGGFLYGGTPTSCVVTAITSQTSITYTVTGGSTPVAGAVTNVSTSGVTDTTADGGGITLKGTTDKTIIWDNTNKNWTSSENLNVATGKTYKVNSVDVLSSTSLGSTVINSSLTKIGLTSTGFVKSDNSGNLTVDTNTYLVSDDIIDLIGRDQNQIPLNQYLGQLAYQNKEQFSISPQSIATPQNNGELIFQLTNDSELEVKVKGSDGTIRSSSLSLDVNPTKYQPIDADLTTIAGLQGTIGYLKKTATNTWILDTNTYSESTHNHTLKIGDGSSDKISYASSDRLDVVGSGTVSITYDDTSNKITISGTDTLQNVSLDDESTADLYPSFVVSTGGAKTGFVSSKLLFNPSTGTLSATSFNSLSDERYKTDLDKITSALAKIKNISGYTYSISNKRSAGLVSQEVQKVLPEAVESSNDKLMLNYDATIALLVEAIKELDEKVEFIKQQLKG